MRSRSLRLRLFVAAAVSIAAALSAAGIGLTLLFERHVERRVENELHSHFLQLVSGLEASSEGIISAAKPLADPRFSQPFSGLYWQVDVNGADVARSRSLWDERLSIPTPPASQEDVHVHELRGPEGAELFAREWLISLPVAGKDQPLVVTVGLDRREIDLAVADFRRNLILSLVLLGSALVLAAWIQVSVGLRPLEVVRERLERVRSGTAARLDGEFPREVDPLAQEVNALLGAQERALERARHRASDLAHGLKTPITLLDSIVRELQRSGNAKAADDVAEQTQAIARHVERELARARLAYGRTSKSIALKPSVGRVLQAMARLPRGGEIAWNNEVADDARMTIEEQDLVELLGNLLDNARKWSRTRVRVASEGESLVVEDDGPGVPEAEHQRIVERGQRLDEKTAGAGLGLAIVHDIAEMHGLEIALSKSPLGGLRVTVSQSEKR